MALLKPPCNCRPSGDSLRAVRHMAHWAASGPAPRRTTRPTTARATAMRLVRDIAL